MRLKYNLLFATIYSTHTHSHHLLLLQRPPHYRFYCSHLILAFVSYLSNLTRPSSWICNLLKPYDCSRHFASQSLNLPNLAIVFPGLVVKSISLSLHVCVQLVISHTDLLLLGLCVCVYSRRGFKVWVYYWVLRPP